MKHLPYGWIIAGYLAIVLFSFLFLTSMTAELEEKHPRFMDKRWKRILWLLSCLLSIPYFVLMAGLPAFLTKEAKRFLFQKKDIKKGSKN